MIDVRGSSTLRGGSFTPAQEVLGGIRMQTEQATGSKPVSSYLSSMISASVPALIPPIPSSL